LNQARESTHDPQSKEGLESRISKGGEGFASKALWNGGNLRPVMMSGNRGEKRGPLKERGDEDRLLKSKSNKKKRRYGAYAATASSILGIRGRERPSPCFTASRSGKEGKT